MKEKATEIYCTRYRKKEWKTPFVAISIAALDILLKELSYSELAIYLAIAKNERSSKRHAPVSYRYLAKAVGCSSSTISKGLLRLQELKLIESVIDGYHIRYFESKEIWEETSKIEEVSRLRKSKENASKIEVKSLQNSMQREEESSTQRRGEKEDSSPPSLLEEVPAFVSNQSQLEAYRISELVEMATTKLASQTAYASARRNPCLTASFYAEGKELPISLEPPGTPGDYVQLFRKTVFITTTNIMHELQAELGIVVPVLPRTLAEARQLGDVVGSFLVRDEWEKKFRQFYAWVISNKDNLSLNLVALYIGDWVQDRQAGGYA